MRSFDVFDKMLYEIVKLRAAYDLLERVYLEHGPYGDRPISDELRYKINDFFDFDDGE